MSEPGDYQASGKEDGTLTEINLYLDTDMGLFTNLAQDLSSPLWIRSQERRIIFANKAYLKIFGTTDYIPCADPRHSHEDDCRDCIVNQAIKHGHPFLGEMITPRGRRLKVLSVPWSLPGVSEQLIVSLGMWEDIPDLDAMIPAKMADILASSSDALITTSLDGRITTWDSGAEQVFGYTRKQAVGMPLSRLAHPQAPQALIEALAFAASGKKTSRQKILSRGRDSRDLVITISAAPVMDSIGHVAGASFIARDVTEFQRFRTMLADSESPYSSIFTNAQVPILLLDQKDALILDANRAAHVFYGLPGDGLIGKKLSELSGGGRQSPGGLRHWPPDDPDGVFFAGQLTAKGRLREVEIRYGPVNSPTEKAFYAVINDVTESRRAILKIKDEQERAQKYLDVAGVIILALDLKGRITLINQKGCQILEDSEENLLGLDWIDNFIPPKMRPMVSGFMEDTLSGKFEIAEYAENPIVTARGNVRQIAWHNVMLKDQAGNISGVLSSGEDITQRVQAQEEAKRLESQLLQAQKMEAIGTLAGGVAHDFNNMLSVIIGYGEITQRKLGPDDEAQHYLDQIIKASERARDLVHQILTFSRQTDQIFKPLNVNPVVKEVVKFLRASLPAAISLNLSLPEADSYVMGDATQIHQVLMNLCTNASQSMAGSGGKIEITLGHRLFSEAELPGGEDLKPGNYLVLSVSDTGKGIDDSLLNRIFEPFFTTKKMGEGTGMGLAVVHGIVKGHHGYIKVESSPGEGARFEVLFPLIEDPPEQINQTPQGYMTGSESILVVDDEKSLVEVTSMHLTNLGYQVQGESDSLRALEVFKRNPEAFDLVITDLSMPGLDGLKLAEKIREIKPAIPMILCSGFSEIESQDHIRELNFKAVVPKPLPIREFSRVVRRALD